MGMCLGCDGVRVVPDVEAWAWSKQSTASNVHVMNEAMCQRMSEQVNVAG